ncbi:hypothetical protein HK099_001341 [Clydaea vesicula]|uniref:AP complex subunit beta n=1 Tax=Clydaea vesicula TaxID=447962 RepID=A0AAD5U3I7_9FUNG|nr:hypothetical protein HK099_001341 [Clydaea vesicula]
MHMPRKIQQLKTELTADKNDKKFKKKAVALKKIVANMTMGNDMSQLFSDVVACLSVQNLEVKKMDISDPNSLVRALSIRTMGYINVDKIILALTEPLLFSLEDHDPYVTKTAALAVAKLYFYDRDIVVNLGLLDKLRNLINHENPMVISNACAALIEIADRSESFGLTFDLIDAGKLVTALNDCSEWGQVYILEALMFVIPYDSNDAELLAERISPRLQHTNSAIILTATKVIIYLTNYISSDAVAESFFRKLGPPLVTLLHNTPEVQYVTLRNILLILQRYPPFLRNDVKVFFCKYNDPIYVKLTKLEVIFKLVTDKNINQVLPELAEYGLFLNLFNFSRYATEIDVDFVRRAVRSIGRCAIKIESSSDKCMEILIQLIETKISYIVQEAVIVIKDIFRKYPNRYESIIKTLCENLENLDEAEAKASIIWIIGQYSSRIDNAKELLELFMLTVKTDPAEVQSALLTAIVKLFIKRPTSGQELVPKILKWATEEVDNPDLRDRGYIYWRLLSSDPEAAKAIVLGEKPVITTETDIVDQPLLEELILHISTLASIYHKPASNFIGSFRPRILEPSPCLVVGRTFALIDEKTITEKKSQENFFNFDNPYHNGTSGELKSTEIMRGVGDFETTSDNIFGQGKGVVQTEKHNIEGFEQFFDQSFTKAVTGNKLSIEQGDYRNPLADLDPLGVLVDIPGSQTGNQQPVNQDFVQHPSTQYSVFQPLINQSLDVNFQSSYQSLPDSLPPIGSNLEKTKSPTQHLNSVIKTFESPNPLLLASPNNPFLSKEKGPVGPSPFQQKNTPEIPTSPIVDIKNDVVIDPFAFNNNLLKGAGSHSIRSSSPEYNAKKEPSSATSFSAQQATQAHKLNNHQTLNRAVPQNPAPISSFNSGSPSDFVISRKFNDSNLAQSVIPPDIFGLNKAENLLKPLILLSAAAGKGLEVKGNFARRGCQVFFDFILSNSSEIILSQFAMLFNKNSFSLAIEPTVNLHSLAPGATVERSLLVKNGGLPKSLMSPINNIQIALQTSIGILYFQSLIFMEVLFEEDGFLLPDIWIQGWQYAFANISEVESPNYMGFTFGSLHEIGKKLSLSNVFSVAQRVVDDVPILYTSVKIIDGTMFLSEIRFAVDFRSCVVATKSQMLEAIPEFHTSLQRLLRK